MDDVERITIELPVALIEEAREAVEAGQYTTLDKAIEQAVHDWAADRMVERIGVDELRRLWDQGIRSGGGAPLDREEVLREAVKRAAEIREAAQIAS